MKTIIFFFALAIGMIFPIPMFFCSDKYIIGEKKKPVSVLIVEK